MHRDKWIDSARFLPLSHADRKQKASEWKVAVIDRRPEPWFLFLRTYWAVPVATWAGPWWKSNDTYFFLRNPSISHWSLRSMPLHEDGKYSITPLPRAFFNFD